tara:strand:+ start:349 stop:495 length:147 start_codon:yes stop_codon:yes gene_type:complete
MELKSFLLLSSKASILNGLRGFNPNGLMNLNMPNIKENIITANPKIEK